MDGKNYWQIKKFSSFYKYYAFIDTEDYFGDQLFIQQEVRVFFGKEYEKKGEKYLIIFCKIRKKDEEKFLKALGRLEKKMILMGNEDYINFCEDIKQKCKIR